VSSQKIAPSAKGENWCITVWEDSRSGGIISRKPITDGRIVYYRLFEIKEQSSIVENQSAGYEKLGGKRSLTLEMTNSDQHLACST
jgi:hypothetical protein